MTAGTGHGCRGRTSVSMSRRAEHVAPPALPQTAAGESASRSAVPSHSWGVRSTGCDRSRCRPSSRIATATASPSRSDHVVRCVRPGSASRRATLGVERPEDLGAALAFVDEQVDRPTDRLSLLLVELQPGERDRTPCARVANRTGPVRPASHRSPRSRRGPPKCVRRSGHVRTRRTSPADSAASVRPATTNRTPWSHSLPTTLPEFEPVAR